MVFNGHDLHIEIGGFTAAHGTAWYLPGGGKGKDKDGDKGDKGGKLRNSYLEVLEGMRIKYQDNYKA